MNRITPSKPDFWTGRRTHEKQRFTDQQESTSRAAGFDPAFLPSHRVKLTTNGERFDEPPAYTFVECPIIDRNHRSRQVLIVTPAGMKQWVKL